MSRAAWLLSCFLFICVFAKHEPTVVCVCVTAQSWFPQFQNFFVCYFLFFLFSGPGLHVVAFCISCTAWFERFVGIIIEYLAIRRYYCYIKILEDIIARYYYWYKYIKDSIHSWSWVMQSVWIYSSSLNMLCVMFNLWWPDQTCFCIFLFSFKAPHLICV